MQLRKHCSLFKVEKFEMESSLLTFYEHRSLMKIYRNFESFFVSAFDGMVWTCLEAIRAKYETIWRSQVSTVILYEPAQHTCICCTFLKVLFFSSCGCRWRRKWRLEVFAFIYGLTLLAFWFFFMLHYFHPFNSFLLACLLACRFFFPLSLSFSSNFTHVFRTLYFNFRGFWNLFLSHLVVACSAGGDNKLDYIYFTSNVVCQTSRRLCSCQRTTTNERSISRLVHYFLY